VKAWRGEQVGNTRFGRFVREKAWEEWLERLYSLRRDKRGSHERPHKPVLLLSILDLLDRGVIAENRIPLSEELARSFRRYFDVVRERDDQPTIQYPYFHLSGDQLWELIPKRGEAPIYRSGATSGAPTVAELRRRVAYGQFDDRLWALMNDPQSRYMLRNAPIARYFPERREQIEAVGTAPLPEQRALRDQQPPGRDAAFRQKSTTTAAPHVVSASC
jgi:putative restriction endonuclease